MSVYFVGEYDLLLHTPAAALPSAWVQTHFFHKGLCRQQQWEFSVYTEGNSRPQKHHTKVWITGQLSLDLMFQLNLPIESYFHKFELDQHTYLPFALSISSGKLQPGFLQRRTPQLLHKSSPYNTSSSLSSPQTLVDGSEPFAGDHPLPFQAFWCLECGLYSVQFYKVS